MITQYLLKITSLLLETYYIIMVIGIFLTWIPSLYKYKFFRILHHIGGGYLKFFRGRIIVAFLDFGPFVGLIFYGFMLSVLATLM